MPTRIVRGELVESESLNRVSMEAELVFVHLLLVADDYGRADGRLDWLRARLFPCRQVAFDQLDGWLSELAAEGCVLRYTVEGRRYVYLTGWENHRGKGRRAEKSRYPDPPTEGNGSEDPQEILGSPGESAKSARLTLGIGTLGIGTLDEGDSASPPGADAPTPAPGRSRGLTGPPEGAEAEEVFAGVSVWALDHRAEFPEYVTAEEIDADQPKLRRVIEECFDWHRANGKRRRDWEATCRNWIRKEPGIAKSRATARAGDEVVSHRVRMRAIEGTAGRRS